MPWNTLAGWWKHELASDPAYESAVTPLLLEILEPESEKTYLDLGCGEGRVARAITRLGARTLGIDLSFDLAREVGGNVVVARLPAIPLRSTTVDGVYAVLTMEHLSDHVRLLHETARVTRENGVLAVVSNHPAWTSPGSTPVQDGDGEVLWRPGEYFSTGTTEVDVDGGTVTFHHRPLGELISAAADAGWSLEKMIEQPHHELEAQSGIPRLIACRWRLLP